MPLTRRALLTTGTASLVVSGLALGGCDVISTDLSAARAPWDDAKKGFGDPRLDAVAYAILAPNPHNRQPWQVHLTGDDALVVSCDLGRRLPFTDPPDRQITIGFGTFLELLRQAAAQSGYRTEIAPFPEGEPGPRLDARPIAHIRLIEDPSVQPDPLFGAILDRRTSRLEFDEDRPVTDETLAALKAVVQPGHGTFTWTNTAEDCASLKTLAKHAWEIEATTQRTLEESTKLTRIGQRAVNAKPDGVSLTGSFIEAMHMAGLLSQQSMARQGSTAHSQTIAFYNGLIDSARAFGWLATATNTRRDQLDAGAAWVRLNLAATKAGLAMQPLSQALQEFPEMTGAYTDIYSFTGTKPPACVQGLFRFGYAKPTPPAPRWPLQSHLVMA